jgi:hypothetical protein
MPIPAPLLQAAARKRPPKQFAELVEIPVGTTTSRAIDQLAQVDIEGIIAPPSRLELF